MLAHINGYALALFSIAQEEKKLKQYKEDALAVIEAVESNVEIIHLMDSKSLPVDTRQELIKKAFKSVNKNMTNFLFILVERSKFNIVIQVLKKFIKLTNNILNIKEGIVYSVDKLSAKELKDVQAKTSKMLGYKVTLMNKLDAELVSGVKIIVGDEIIEDTVISRLEQIKYELLKREEN